MNDKKILAALARFINDVINNFPDTYEEAITNEYGLSEEEWEYAKELWREFK